MKIDEFDYELSPELIAQTPIEPRDHSRLLVDAAVGLSSADALDVSASIDAHVYDLPNFLRPNDLLVLNDTKVMPARLNLFKKSGGAAEVLLLEPLNLADHTWKAMIKPARRLAPGTELVATPDGPVVVVVGEQITEDGLRSVVLNVSEADLDAIGSMPLPHYITAPLQDPARYQTVYAQHLGSVAAPTAGLHLTTELLDEIESRGVNIARVELRVGLGTFKPVSVDDLDDHVMHRETYRVPDQVVEQLEQCRRDGGRVVCVGTTSLRAIESLGLTGQQSGSTDLFVRPGFAFRYTDVLLTNFHLPKSTLLCLIAAFYGDHWRDLYAVATERRYRFLSFGDAMLLARSGPRGESHAS